MVAAQDVQNQAASSFAVHNPADGSLLKELPIHSPAQVKAEVERARAAQRRWGETPIEERCKAIERVAHVISKRADEIAQTITQENGKVPLEAAFEVGATLLVMNYFIENGPRILRPEPIRLAITRHRSSYISYRPKGVLGVITPWNYPHFMPGSDVPMALIAGNAVVLKPSEVTPLSSLLLKACYDEGGLDPDLFRVVTGLGATGAGLIEALPDHVVFTGSVNTGRRVGVACAERLIPYTLELGGKAPAVVLDDADVERTANAIVWGGFSNTGQICASVERVYASASIYDALVDKVTEGAKKLTLGVEYGPLTWPRQREVVEALVADARAKGARITTGGERVGDPKGNYYAPTVIADCRPEMSVMSSEAFGPVVPLMKVSGEDEALRLANDSPLGLGAYVFSKDRERALRVAERLEAGSIMVNDVLMHAGLPEMPWGGIKQSGLGVVRSERGLKELCHARHVNYDRVPSLPRDPYWFPYTESRTRQIKGMLRRMFDDGVGGKLFRKLLS